MARSFTSKVTPVRSDSPAVRTSVPEAVAAFLDVEAGDALEWVLDPASRRVVVRKSASK